MKELLTFKDTDQNYWIKLKVASRTLESEYKKLSPNTMFFDVLLKDRFLERCQDRYMMLKKEFPERNDTERWDSHEIDKMFGKGLNHNSLITNFESVTWLLNDKKEIDTVVEFGPGAGWSTVILYRVLKNNNQKPLIYSIDSSTHAIAASTVLLDFYEIPWILIRDEDEYRFVNSNIESYRNYVILQYDDFEKALKVHSDNSVDKFYSAHGTAYLSEVEYVSLLKIINKKGKNGSTFVTDSLDPTYSVELSKIGTILRMIYPNYMKKYQNDPSNWYIYSGTKKCGSIYYDVGQDVKIMSNLNDPRSFILYTWINKLIKKLDVKRILEIKKSLELTAHIIEQYREDVYPSSLMDKLINKNNLSSCFKLIDTENKPDWPPFMATVKLLIEK